MSTEIQLHEQVQLLRNYSEALREAVSETFGSDDSRTIHAGQICDTVQRLQWDLERQADQANHSDAAHG